jgi:hypothetical protein
MTYEQGDIWQDKELRMQQQIEENNKRQQTEFRNMQEMLLQAMKHNTPPKSKDYEDILKSNQVLSDTIKSVEDRNHQLS